MHTEFGMSPFRSFKTKLINYLFLGEIQEFFIARKLYAPMSLLMFLFYDCRFRVIDCKNIFNSHTIKMYHLTDTVTSFGCTERVGKASYWSSSNTGQ